MAMTPTVKGTPGGSSGTTHNFASFTPTANSVLYLFGTSRGTATTAGLTPTTSGLTWEYIDGIWQGTGGNHVSITCWYALITTASAMTVQGIDTGATKVGITILEITNSFRGAPLNFGSFGENAGDPWPTIGTTPATSSCMLGCFAGCGTNAPAPPTNGYTELADFAAGTDLRTEVCYNDDTAEAAAQWVTTNTVSAAVLMEIGAAAAAGARQYVSVTTW